MQRILVCNLKRGGDIYYMAPYLRSLREIYKDVKITLVIFKEFSKFAKELVDCDQVVEIDRRKIEVLWKSELFSNAYALDEFINNLADILNIYWDKAVNYSNDKVSSYLISYLVSKNLCASITGTIFGSDGRPYTSDNWNAILNEILTRTPFPPFSYNECFLRAMNVKTTNFDNLFVVSDSYEEKVKDSFSKIRKAYNEDVSLLGIQLTSSIKRKNLPKESILKIIENTLDEGKCIPIILTSPLEVERKLSAEINRTFGNGLIIIETNPRALTSVLKNLDYLVTPDTLTSQAAVLLGTKTLHVSLGPSPLFKQGPSSKNFLVLTKSLKKRDWTWDNLNLYDDLPSDGAILKSLEVLMGGKLSENLGEDILLFRH